MERRRLAGMRADEPFAFLPCARASVGYASGYLLWGATSTTKQPQSFPAVATTIH